MAVVHAVEPWRLRRRYFLRPHYRAGKRYGKFELPDYSRKIPSAPPFLGSQVVRQFMRDVRVVPFTRLGLLR
jgi:hypothetical protein